MIRVRHGIIAGVLLVLITLATVLIWLLTTSYGAQWALFFDFPKSPCTEISENRSALRKLL